MLRNVHFYVSILLLPLNSYNVSLVFIAHSIIVLKFYHTCMYMISFFIQQFSDKVLQGREVAFHTIPKTGPIKIAIRGGTDTPLGGAIYISRILEGGAAARQAIQTLIFPGT